MYQLVAAEIFGKNEYNICESPTNEVEKMIFNSNRQVLESAKKVLSLPGNVFDVL